MWRVKSRNVFLIILMLDMVFFSSVCGAEVQNNLFKIHDEIKISSSEMNCDYEHEDYAKYGYNFEYPKLIITDDRNPLVAFIDENAKALIFAEVTDQGVKGLNSIVSDDNNLIIWPISDGKYLWEEWPIIFTRENKTSLASIPGSWAKEDKKIKIYSLNMDTKRVHLNTDMAFRSNELCRLSGIFPYRDKYMIVGRCNYSCWRYLPWLFQRQPYYPIFYHNASFVLEENKFLKQQSIEEEGCFSAEKSEYAVSDSGSIYSAWVRNTKTVKRKYDMIVYYSINKDGTKWGKPLELYAVKDIEDFPQLYNLSLVSNGNSAFLLWQDYKNGLYFAELKNEKRYDPIKINDMKITDNLTHGSLEFASTIKVASDKERNAYALWTANSDDDYRLYLKARINGKWTQEMIINRGYGFLKLPDMKVDKEGRIHITYIKSINPQKTSAQFGCYYMKLERK